MARSLLIVTTTCSVTNGSSRLMGGGIFFSAFFFWRFFPHERLRRFEEGMAILSWRFHDSDPCAGSRVGVGRL